MFEFRDHWLTRRVATLLIFSLLLEITAPAFASPWWEQAPRYPQARRRGRSQGRGPADPLVQRALQQANPRVGQLPQGANPDLFPGQESNSPAPDQPQGDSTPAPSQSATPIPEVTPSLREEVVAEPEARHSSTQKAELAVLLADPRAEYPPYEIARQNRQDGPFFQPQVIHVASEVFVNDYLTHLTQRYNEPTNDEVIRWDFISPVAANNKTSRGSAASLEWRYRAQGSDPADFKANYKLEVKIWDRSCPSGRVLYRRQEKTKLCFLRPHCAIAARDLGVWEVRMTRNGQDAGMKAFDVKLPPVADQEGFSRRLNEGYRPLDSDGAFTSDEWLHHQKTYTPEPPNRRGRQKQTIEWDFKSPQFKENCNRRGAYYSLTQEYESDGQSSTVRERLYDSLYPQGHTYRISTSTGRLESLRLLGGPGLSNFGDLTFKERASGEVHSQKIPVRKILAFVQLPAGNMYQNNGSTAYGRAINAASQRTGIPSEVISATLSAELAGGGIQGIKFLVASLIKDSSAVSTGIAQFKPFRAADTDTALGRPVKTVGEYQNLLQDPQQAIDYLADTLVVSTLRYAGSFNVGSDEYWALIAIAHNDLRYLDDRELDAKASRYLERIKKFRQIQKCR